MAYLYASDGSRRWQRQYSKGKVHSEAEPHTTYAIYQQTHTLCVLQYSNYWPKMVETETINNIPQGAT